MRKLMFSFVVERVCTDVYRAYMEVPDGLNDEEALKFVQENTNDWSILDDPTTVDSYNGKPKEFEIEEWL